MAKITTNNQRFIEKYVFRFFCRYSVPLPILVNICIIPIKSDAFTEQIPPFRHNLKYMLAIYNAVGSFERQSKGMATDRASSALPTTSWDKEFFEDPIVAELDAYREQHAAQFDFDIDRIVADIRSKEPQNSDFPIENCPEPLNCSADYPVVI